MADNIDFGTQIAYRIKNIILMKRDKVHSSVIITFQKPIIERDDGQNINSCMVTHSEKTRVAQ